MKTQTIKPLDPQEAFSKVWKHFVVQKGEPSVHDGLCMYRYNYGSTSETRCAIGVLIPDDIYNKSWENGTIYSLVNDTQRWGDAMSVLLSKEKISFWSDLQWCHDMGSNARLRKDFTGRIKTKLISFAEKYDLEVPKL